MKNPRQIPGIECLVFLLRRYQWPFEHLCFTVVTNVVIHGQMPNAGDRPASFNVFKLFWSEVGDLNHAVMLDPVIPFFHEYLQS